MAKKSKVNVLALCGLVAAVFGIVAILMELLSGYVIKTTGGITGTESVTKYSVFQLIFGCDATATMNDKGEVVNHVNVGLLIAFILLVLGTLGSVCAAFASLKDKKTGGLLACCSALFLIAAGVLFFCTGSLTGLDTGETDAIIIKGKASFGAGVWLTAVFSCVAGVADLPVVLGAFKK